MRLCRLVVDLLYGWLLNSGLEIEIKGMREKKEKVEDSADCNGEAVGKGVKKGTKAINDCGKRIKKGIRRKNRQDYRGIGCGYSPDSMVDQILH
jgi:hypothetical protein